MTEAYINDAKLQLIQRNEILFFEQAVNSKSRGSK